jgi:flagellar basal-body rod modification protein FlgD
MPTTPISNAVPALSTGTTKTAPAAVTPKDQFGKDTFMKLLVAQMKYQNPMQPTDPGAFLTQSAQFSVVEKLSQLATQGEATSKLSQMTTAAAFMGKKISYALDGTPAQGVVTGVKFPAGQSPVMLIGKTEVSLDAVQGVDVA